MTATKKAKIVPGSSNERMLFHVYGREDLAWDEGGEEAVLRRLRARKLVKRGSDGVWSITSAGKTALGVPMLRGRSSFTRAAKAVVAALFPARDGQDPVIVDVEAEAGEADALLATISGLPTESEYDTQWEYWGRLRAVETFLNEAGFPCTIRPHDVLMDDNEDDVRTEEIPGFLEVRAL